MRSATYVRGMSFVEAIVSIAVFVLIFGGLFASFQLMVSLIGKSKAESGALALLNERLEYIRSLPYDDVGTVGGIPDGPIPQFASTTLNEIDYTERILIEFVDAPEDGEGADDENGIVADYKRVKVEYSWNDKGETQSRSLISSIVPRGIETTAGGGTLRVNVFDSMALPVEGAEVHLSNDTGTTTIDTIRYTNESGVALISGAPALSGYEIIVTKEGFSTDQTYSATAENQNPVTPHVAVLESEVSTMNFQIDALADLIVRTVGVPDTDAFDDTFDDETGLVLIDDLAVFGGTLMLAGAPGSYAEDGDTYATSTAPSVIDAWGLLTFDTSVPTSTDLTIKMYAVTGTSTYTLIPDEVLPENSIGTSTSPIDLSSLNPDDYPALAAGVRMSTSDSAVSPALHAWSLSYTITEPSVGDVAFTLTGSKIIGTQADLTPVYKYSEAVWTDADGGITLTGLEWDTYDVRVNDFAYDIAEACAALPYVLEPGAHETLKLTLADASVHSLRVTVKDTNGQVIPGAEISLIGTGVNESAESSLCGQTYIGGIPSGEEYQLQVTIPGYATYTQTELTVLGTTSLTVVLSSS